MRKNDHKLTYSNASRIEIIAAKLRRLSRLTELTHMPPVGWFNKPCKVKCYTSVNPSSIGSPIDSCSALFVTTEIGDLSVATGKGR